MRDNTKNMVRLLSLLVIIEVTLAESFNCYTCTYTISGDPSIDYECVTSPQLVTKGIPSVSCQSPYLCTTRANFNTRDMTQVRSVTRSCLPQQELCSGDTCCNMNGPYPTCEHKCRTNMCNGINAEEFRNSGQTGSGSQPGNDDTQPNPNNNDNQNQYYQNKRNAGAMTFQLVTSVLLCATCVICTVL